MAGLDVPLPDSFPDGAEYLISGGAFVVTAVGLAAAHAMSADGMSLRKLDRAVSQLASPISEAAFFAEVKRRRNLGGRTIAQYMVRGELRPVDLAADVYAALKQSKEPRGQPSTAQTIAVYKLVMGLAEAGEGAYAVIAVPDATVRSSPAPDAILRRQDGHVLVVEATQVTPHPRQIADQMIHVETLGEVCSAARGRILGTLHLIVSPRVRLPKVGRLEAFRQIADSLVAADKEIEIGEHRQLPFHFSCVKTAADGARLGLVGFVPDAVRLFHLGAPPRYEFALHDAFGRVLEEAKAKFSQYQAAETVVVVQLHANLDDTDRVIASIAPLRSGHLSVRRLYVFEEWAKPLIRIW